MLTAIRALAEAAEAEQSRPVAELLEHLVGDGEAASREHGSSSTFCARRAWSTPARPACRALARNRIGRRRPAAAEQPAGRASVRRSRPSGALAVSLLHDVRDRGRSRPRRARGQVRTARRLAARRRGPARAEGSRPHGRPRRGARDRYARGAIENVEIADMHRQTEARERRLLAAVPDPPHAAAASSPSSAGAGNWRLFESLGAAQIVEGGQTMNPSAAELARCNRGDRRPRRDRAARTTPTSCSSPNRPCRSPSKPVLVVPTTSHAGGPGGACRLRPRAAGRGERGRDGGGGGACRNGCGDDSLSGRPAERRAVGVQASTSACWRTSRSPAAPSSSRWRGPSSTACLPNRERSSRC